MLPQMEASIVFYLGKTFPGKFSLLNIYCSIQKRKQKTKPAHSLFSKKCQYKPPPTHSPLCPWDVAGKQSCFRKGSAEGARRWASLPSIPGGEHAWLARGLCL